MIIEIDTGLLNAKHITAHQFVIAKLAYEEDYKSLEKYITATNSVKTLYEDLDILRLANYIKSSHPTGSIISYKNIKVSDEFKNLFSVAVNAFDEFYNAFPVKSIRTDGTNDYLRVDRDMCKKIYYNLVFKNPSLHSKILISLKTEVEDRTNKGTMHYMKRMPKWLSSEAWKAYDNSDQDGLGATREDNYTAYGTSIE